MSKMNNEIMIDENKSIIEEIFGIRVEDMNESDTGRMLISVA